MPTRFDARFGQELCDVLSAELGLVCSFMGEQGRIVASSVRERIGSTHDIAAQIMRGEIDEYGVTREEAAKSAVMREGINMGIDFAGTRLICFAIAGPLEVVRPLARIVRFSVTSLLRVWQDDAPPSVPRESAPDVAPTLEAAAVSGRGATPPNAGSLVTLLSRASQTMELSLSRLRDAVDHVDQGITMFDAELRLVVWNRRFLELIGMPASLIGFGMTLEAILSFYAEHAGYAAGEREAAVAQRMALARSRRINHFEHTRPDGTVLAVVDRPLQGGGFVSTYTDVTHRHQAERALRAAYEGAERLVEERTRDLSDFASLSSDWFWEQDAQFRFTRFFGHSTNKLRREPADFLGQRRWDLPIDGVTPQQMAQHIACHERHQPFRNFEYRIAGEDGSIQYFSVSGAPRFDAQGTFVGYHGIGSNVTDLRLAEFAVRQRERQLSQIVDGTSIATFVIDAEHRITHWNQACAKLTGLSAADRLGQTDVWRAFYDAPRPTMADLVLYGSTEDTLAAHYASFSHSTLIEGAIEAEGFFPDMGDSGRWLYFTAAPLRDSAGALTGAIETLQDITERRRVQGLLEGRTEALQRAYSEMEERVVERTAELNQQLGFLQQLIEAIPGPVFYQDAKARYLGCNSAYEAFIGRPVAELIGRKSSDMAPAELTDRPLPADQDLLEMRGAQIYEAKVRYADGQVRDVMFHKATFTLPDGSVGGLVGLMLDISQRKQMEDNLRQAATVFDNSAEGVIIAQTDGTIIAVNRAFSAITGYQQSEVIGRNPRMLQSGRHDKSFYADMWASIERRDRWQGEVWNRRKNGEIFAQWISIMAVRDTQHRLTNYVATFSDITDQKQNEERIQSLAFSDPLTALPNRRLLLDHLHHALVLSARTRRSGALFFIDLDNFKALNDTRGHDIGDLLLKQVAERLQACIRAGDTVARLGGDEFVVMLEGLSENSTEAFKQAESVGAKIQAALTEPYLLQGGVHHNTPSIGVTLFGDQQSSLEELLKQADLAMYRAKASGRNALRFFDPEMQSVVGARVALEAELRQGLARSEFLLHYQPQVAGDGGLTGVEALVRWRHPVRGTVAPAEFIALAEETGLIVPLGHWVLETACAQLARWASCPGRAHLTVAVNVSARQFHSPDFVDQVLEVLDLTGADPKRLKLELTESLLVTNVDDVIAKMSLLKAKGVGFSLDDFGTGYSSLSYLKRLPLDQLKIDRGFVSHILTDPNDAAIAQMVVALAQTLGLEVVAEGVEIEAQRDLLARQGCHVYQGYLFSPPLSIEAFEVFADAVLAPS